MRFAVPITKVDEQADGSVVVHGLCTNDTVDLDTQIIDLAFSRKGLAEWGANWGNIRQMHSTNLPPAGTALNVDTLHPEGVMLTAKVVEPGAVKLVREGVYRAFSVGISRPRIVRDKVAKGGRVTDGVFSEVSLVDFPALPVARFGIVKRTKREVKKLEKRWTRMGVMVTKKDMDPSVGGGVDRDKIPAEDFAGKNRSFPIVTPGDVSDAASSIGRAGDDNYSAGTLKANIIAIANRKGPKFVAELPEAWTADDDNKTVEPDLTKDGDGKCSTCNGTGKIREGHVKCPDCDGTGKSGGQGATSDTGSEDTQGSGDDDMGKVADPSDAAYVLRRAHDALCMAYPWEVVTTAHPAVAEKGLSGILDPNVLRTVLAQNATAEAADPVQLMALSKAYGSAQILADIVPEVVAEERETLHKAFAATYPDAHPTPGNVTPGQFQRPFIATGRAPDTPSGSPRIPAANSTVDAETFDRGPLTAGQEAPSPANAGDRSSSTLSAADQLTAISRDQATAAMTALHDHISALYPEICPVGGPAGVAAGGFAGGRETLDTDGSITPLKAGKSKLEKAQGRLKRARRQVKKLEKVIGAGGTNVTQTAGADDPKLKEARKRERKLEKAVKAKKAKAKAKARAKRPPAGDVTKAAVVAETGEVLIDTAVLTDIVRTAVASETEGRFKDLTKAYEALKADVDAFGSEPDPAAAPIRSSVVVQRAVEPPAPTPADVLKASAEARLQEEITYVRSLTKSGNPELRQRAQDRLNELLERTAFTAPVEDE